MGADTVQIFTQSPRRWAPVDYGPGELDSYREAQQDHPRVRSTFCHATYLINLAGTRPEMTARSRECLVSNLEVAAAIGSAGLVLHVGSHLGAGLDAVAARVAATVLEVLDEVGGGTPILLENTAGAGGTIGRSFEELATVIAAAGGDERLGVCLDTQHLFAAGTDFTTRAGADAAVAGLERTLGLDRLRCLHLNDSKVALGANLDRHENLGAGEIGAGGLASLLGHPALQQLPAILEVPGALGHGPAAEDIEQARRIHAAGVLQRARRRPRRPAQSAASAIASASAG
jgi:deoxyribonuclease-4